MKSKGLAAFLMSAALAVPVFAQDAEDGPGRGVARISVMSGDVSMRRGDTGDLVAAAINAPLVVQDRLLTGPSSKAEVQFDWANMIRLGPMSEIRLSDLENHRYQIQIASGTVTFRVLRDANSDVELSTPNISVRPMKKGIYRLTVRDDGTTEVTVRSGEAEIFSPRGSETLRSGRTMVARGTAADPEFQIYAAIPSDEWDRWNERRDHDLERSRSYQYVSRDVYGAEDLDSYGTWVQADDYGWVWSPRVAVGWAPYRSGRWVWEDWYGWTWVSYDPWGWAPYHYGRWFYGPRYGWCWWPGGGGRHYWSPALVAFFGYGGHSGVGFGFGGIGWVPLGPREPLHRWWGSGYNRGYGGRNSFNNITVVNNVNITNVYRNARVADGMTGVNVNDFTRGSTRYGRLPQSDVRGANLVRGQLPVAPTRDHLRLADREVRAGSVPQNRNNENFYSRRPAATVQRVPFEQQRQSIEQSARRSMPEVARGSGASAPQTVQPAGRPAEAQNGWRRFGEPAVRGSGSSQMVQPSRAPETGRTSQPAARGDSSGWRGFGDPANASRSSQRPQMTEPSRAPETGRTSQPAARGDSSGWRGFGDPANASRSSQRPQMTEPSRAPETGRTSQPAARGDSSGWRGFGQSQNVPRASEAPSSRGRQQSGSAPTWDRQSSGSVDRGAGRYETPRYSAPQREYQAPQRQTPQAAPRYSAPSRSSEPIRVSPPIVQQRSAPAARSESHSSGGGQSRGGNSNAGGGGRGESRGGGRSR